jgi:WD40 repeat protein
VLSAGHVYAVAGIRKELYIWSMENGSLVKCLDAHFARIIDIQPLTVGSWNSVITSSIDRTVKVWNMNYIFEQVHHIDRHELQIDSVSVCTKLGVAVTVTRNCIGIWDLLTGKLRYEVCIYGFSVFLKTFLNIKKVETWLPHNSRIFLQNRK